VLLSVALAFGLTACEATAPSVPTQVPTVVAKLEIAQSSLSVGWALGDGAYVVPDQLVEFYTRFVIRGASKPVTAAVVFRSESGTETYENKTLVYGPFNDGEFKLNVAFRFRDGLLTYAQGKPGQAIGVFVRFSVDGKTVAEFNQFKLYLK
jgi:hypothetical protein